MARQKIYRLVEKGSHGSRIYLIFDNAIMSLIVLNVVALILESLPELREPYGFYFQVFEIFSIIIFSIEYLLRIYVSSLTHPTSSKIKSAIKFMISPLGLIDLLAVLPFYLPLLIAIDLRFLRMLRLMRFMLLLKINRYNLRGRQRAACHFRYGCDAECVNVDVI